MKWIVATCAACVALLLFTAWELLRAGDIAPPEGAAAADPAPAPSGRAAELLAARKRGDAPELDRFVAEQQAIVARAPDDRDALRLCAEALLERVLLRNQLRGLVVGEPLYAELPAPVQADLDEAARHLARARQLGDDSATNFRIEASLMSQRITGLGAALQWNGKIERALQAAAQKAPHDPALHVALGLRKLLAPKLLGHDAEAALQHFEFAARSADDDDRPRVFAAMACWLLKRRQQAIGWLEQAVARNPGNPFARAVLKRLVRGEDDAFARDVGLAEAAEAR